MFGLIKKIFGTAQVRQLRRYRKIVEQINMIEEEYQQCSDVEIRDKVVAFRLRLQDGETTEDLLPEAYALVKNACRRLIGTDIHVSGYDQKWDMIPYDVQMLGAIAMHYGLIAEMMTGEGKTLTAAMPLFLNALTGKATHLVTVNDYLAERDCDWIGEIFRWLGLTVRALVNQVSVHERKELYEADIVYGTASEFGFDYLRDNSMAQSSDEQCQRGHYFAIIDEVDSVLIDEARTPLIISGPASQSRQMYDELKQPVSRIVRLQRDQCNMMAADSRKVLERLGRLKEDEREVKLSREEARENDEAFKWLWIVGKGTPKNKVLKRLKENPALRAELERWETYFYSEANKDERHEMLAKLHIIIDERANEYELTDKGIQAWISEKSGLKDDFIMPDLGHEYSEIDNDESISEKEKMQKKIAVREEDARRKERFHNLRQLFRAHLLMEKDVDYIVQDQKIVIIDENTGRPQPGRRFSDGLHQSIEAKENVPVQQETQTYATITLQNYFRLYDKLAGMTGTAMTEAQEFKEIYKMGVLEIPTHKKCIRVDINDAFYMSEREKYQALVEDITLIHAQGRPILIGTESVEVSEKLARILKQRKLRCTILNAKHPAKEAEIVAQAGKKGAITVATNMAGRGTDIKLDKESVEKGGLYVIGNTRHRSRRIDKQLIGRCARQGDPGTSKFYISLEDQLMRLFAPPKLVAFLQRVRPPEGELISAKILNRSIENAQKRVEQRNYLVRKHTLQYDDVMNKQRQEVYAFRNRCLHEKDPIKMVREVLEDVAMQITQQFFDLVLSKEEFNPHHYTEWLMTQFPITFQENLFEHASVLGEIAPITMGQILEAFETKLEIDKNVIVAMQDGNEKVLDFMTVLHMIVRRLLIQNIDRFWQEHLLSIDHLHTEVNMHVVGQKDPLTEFKHEAFFLFDSFSRNLKLQISHAFFKFEIMTPHTLKQKSAKKMQEHWWFNRAEKP